MITRGGVWANGEVAYLAWEVDQAIPGCLGFMITRVHETGPDAGQRRILPTWIAFTDQNNPNWNEQDSSVWPIQRFDWRDLTLRKSRDTAKVRPIDFRVHYEIVAVGLDGPERIALPPSATASAVDVAGHPSFDGPKHPLFQIGAPFVTGPVDVTHSYGQPGAQVAATFTNGILSTQNIVRQLESLGLAHAQPVPTGSHEQQVVVAQKREAGLLKTLQGEIIKPGSDLRSFLHGDVPDFLGKLIDRARASGGEVYLALYELTDPVLVPMLVEAMKDGLIHLILSTAGQLDPNPKGTPKDAKQPVAWDTENDAARKSIRAEAKGALSDRMIDRMFNTQARIGHNKFAVYVVGDKARAVLTGSTNWTPTGLCTQSNNSMIIENDDVAGDYWAYWKRLRDDPQPERVAYTVIDSRHNAISGARPSNGRQAAKIRSDNAAGFALHALDAHSSARVWASPNTKSASVPDTDPAVPPDLAEIYDLMDAAKQAILFLTFLPGLSGKNNIIGKAAQIAQAKPDMLVLGVISDPSALPPPSNDTGGPKTYVDAKGKTQNIPPPAIWWPLGEQSRIAMIRAAAVRVPFGNLRPELLTAGHAIIHNKVIIIDPLDPVGSVIITGSHNLGFKASYCNDDNLVIIRGNSGLATAYAVHALDLYDHYVMRARIEQTIHERLASGQIHSFEEAVGDKSPHGLLQTDDGWQQRFLNPPTQGVTTARDYFLGSLP